MAADVSPTEQVIERCKAARFTGILRIHAAQGEGELRFVSGITNGVRFGATVDDEAMERILAAEDPKVELVPRLPAVEGGPKRGYPLVGALGPLRAVDLFRFCESESVTCTLELEAGAHSGTAAYELGELLSVSCDEGTDSAVAEMLEWAEGRYRFVLPVVELPESVQLWGPVSSRSIVPEALPEAKEAPSEEAVARTKEHEAKIRRKAGELAAKHKTELATAEQRSVDAEAKRRADEADAKKRADEADAKKRADEADAKKRADEADAKKRADEADARKRADEADARKRADEADARKRADEADAKKRADEAEVAAEAEDTAGDPERADDAQAAESAKPEAEPTPEAVSPAPKEVAARPRKIKKAVKARATTRRRDAELAAGDAERDEAKGARDRRPEMYFLILLGLSAITAYLLSSGKC